MTATVVVPYGGLGGWCQGLRTLGLDSIGIELDAAACRTRNAAGHRTIRADVAMFPFGHLAGRVDGAIFSPPCQSFSTAGNGEGRALLDVLCRSVQRGGWWDFDRDGGYGHVLEVGRWAETLRPTWIACEQVPPCLPIWQAYADRWRSMGWSAWAGILNAADYGVPQTRRRAFLIARTDGQPVHPPEPTHCEGGALTMFGELAPWVSMADALGWTSDMGTGHETARGSGMRERHGERRVPMADEVSQTITSKARSWVVRTGANSMVTGRTADDVQPYERSIDQPAPTVDTKAGSAWVMHMPATTVTGDPRITARCHRDEGSQGANAVTVEQAMTGDYDGTSPIRLTIRDALILQGFDPDYPLQGTRTKQFEQVGNAVPPPLAAAVIGAVTGTRTLLTEVAS